MSISYCILPTSELRLLDFSRLIETDQNIVRRSLDGELAVVSWYGETPDFITWPVLTHEQAYAITLAWPWANPELE